MGSTKDLEEKQSRAALCPGCCVWHERRRTSFDVIIEVHQKTVSPWLDLSLLQSQKIERHQACQHHLCSSPRLSGLRQAGRLLWSRHSSSVGRKPPHSLYFGEKFNIGFFAQTFGGSSYTCMEARKKFWAEKSMLNFSR